MLILGILGAMPAGPGLAADWPTYQHDVARSGITDEKVNAPLVPCWTFHPAHAPQPAWGDPKPEPVEGILELRRVHFDDVYHVAVAGDRVFFGSSADHKLTCLDAPTGRVRWTKVTGGPIRLAPTVDGGRIYFGSDDGYAYCLDAADGSEVWRFHAAPEDRRVLGHGKMISLWPLRSGVLVDGGVAYFSAGIFPAEGVFFYAVDAETGTELWRNDSTGEAPQSPISPQGYLLASETMLYAPMGRVSPAALSRADGSLRYTSFFGKTIGGTYALLAGEQIYTGTEELLGYNKDTRDRFAVFAGRRIIVDGETAYLATDTELSALRRTASAAASRKLQSLRGRRESLTRGLRTAGDRRKELEAAMARLDEQIKQAQDEMAAATPWKTPSACDESLILAGGVLFAGGDKQVMAVEAETGKPLWTGNVDGEAKGLAAAGGHLFVSTDQGTIYCFGPEGSPRHGEVRPAVDERPFADSPLDKTFREAAEAILNQSGVTRGYCLVVGCETGQLAYELAKRSELTVYVVSPDAEKVAAARKKLDDAAVQGARVCVEQWPLDRIPYADYFADLIVSETAIAGGELPPDPDAVLRMLKPAGGVAITKASQGSGGDAEAVQRWIARSHLADQLESSRSGPWMKVVRGPIPGGGSWTHQYGNPGNTACGDDTAVKCPLRVLWFGRPGPAAMVNRHQRAAAPVALDGRLFVEGENVVMAYDMYNGVQLWRRPIPGAIRANASHDSSNLAVATDGLYVAVRDKCLRLDPATGQTAATYEMPPGADARPDRWGYVAKVGKLLYGSRSVAGLTSECLFAVDTRTGKPRWSFDGWLIPHTAIAISDGRVFLVDSSVTPEQRQAVLDARRDQIAKLPEAEKKQAEAALARADVRRVVALDAETGEVLWERPVDLTHCGGGGLAVMADRGAVVLFGVYLDGHHWQEFFAGEFDSRRVTVLSAADGHLMWSHPVGYRVRPLIIGDTLHAEPWAYDLLTGEPRTRVHPITGEVDRWQFARPGHHCGCPVGSPNCLFFRSYCLGYYDLLGDFGTMHFGAQRPGCWVNCIPAGGVVLVPEASAGCMCPFPNMCSVVLQPSQQNHAWAYYSAPGAVTPVRRLALDFGAPGDRNDSQGQLWLGFPRPYQGRLVLELDCGVSFYPGGGYTQGYSAHTGITGTDDPWLFASAARGLRKCEIPLRGPADGTALYRVRLGFADVENSRPGQRAFDIKLQGRVVEEAFDPVAAAGGPDRAVIREYPDIAVDQNLVIELVPRPGSTADMKPPVLNAVEILQQEVISLGCTTPRFLLSTLQPKQAGELELANLRDEPFAGTLELAVPKGFSVSPARTDIRLRPGDRKKLSIEAAVGEDVPAGDYAVAVRLVRDDGSVALEKAAPIEHLGRRGRLVFKAAEDAYVAHRYPELNKGSAAVLLVDGGNQRMGDTDHNVAYLKFRPEVPGKPVSVVLRIHNAGNPTGDSGRVCLVTQPWSEGTITYAKRPKPGAEVGRLGAVSERQVVTCPLKLDLAGMKELSLVIEPTSRDGVDYLSRESDQPPELVVEFEPEPNNGSE